MAHEPDAFYFALEQSPGDKLTLLMLADWYEDHGQSDNADCLRWCHRLAIWPFRYSANAGLAVAGASFAEGWYWWANDETAYGNDWGHPQNCRLPHSLWSRLKNPFPWTPLVFKHYPTLRTAYEALFAVWPLVKPAQRERS